MDRREGQKARNVSAMFVHRARRYWLLWSAVHDTNIFSVTTTSIPCRRTNTFSFKLVRALLRANGSFWIRQTNTPSSTIQIPFVIRAPGTMKSCMGVDCPNEAGTLQCPTCQKNGKDSFFCSQDCFKRSWVLKLCSLNSWNRF